VTLWWLRVMSPAVVAFSFVEATGGRDLRFRVVGDISSVPSEPHERHDESHPEAMMHPIPAPHIVQIGFDGSMQTVTANVVHLSANHYQVMVTLRMFAVRLSEFDGVPLTINGIRATQVLAQNANSNADGWTMLVLSVLLP
jgi:hypothetical protein